MQCMMTIRKKRDKDMKNKMLLALTFATVIGLGVSAQAQDSTAFPPLNNGTSVSHPASHYTFRDTGARGTGGKTRIETRKTPSVCSGFYRRR